MRVFSTGSPSPFLEQRLRFCCKQGKRDFHALNATGGAFSNLGVGLVWIQ
jgi:hypothetical protein